MPPDIEQQLQLSVGEQVKFKSKQPLNLGAFARAIAKIAYCNAVANFGLGGFRPLVLPQLIRGKYTCIAHFVGNQPGEPPSRDRPNLLHQIGFKEAKLEGQSLLVASIRLFANCGTDDHGMPIYNVVMGVPFRAHCGA